MVIYIGALTQTKVGDIQIGPGKDGCSFVEELFPWMFKVRFRAVLHLIEMQCL